jgi:hypothetical protein
MNLQEAQSYIRDLIRSLYEKSGNRPTSIRLIGRTYNQMLAIANPFNMTTIAWLEKTCNVEIINVDAVKELPQLNYLDILDRL